MYDVSDPRYKLGAVVTLNDLLLQQTDLRLKAVKIIDEYSRLSLTFSKRVNLPCGEAVFVAQRAVEGLGFPLGAQRVVSARETSKFVDVAIEVQCLVADRHRNGIAVPLPHGVVFKTIARQISVPHAYLMMWARLYLYPDGCVSDDEEDIFFRAGSELLKHLPWWERWRPAYLGEDAIWEAEDGTVHFDYRLGEHYYAENLPAADGMSIINPNDELLPILWG